MKMVFLKHELSIFGATNSLLRCVALALVVALAGCADKPTYEIDYDQNFTFTQYQGYPGMTTTMPPEKASIAARIAVISECARRPMQS